MDKTCRKCSAVKDVGQFHVDRASKDGRNSLCKECLLNLYHRTERGKASKQSYYERNKPQFVASGLKFKYKFGPFEFDRRVKAQNGKCAICLRIPSVLHVDHDNQCCNEAKTRSRGTCGKCVRSLLCEPCNNGLACFRDDTASLARAIRYLRHYAKLRTASPPSTA